MPARVTRALGLLPPASYDLRDHYSHCEADKPGNQGQCGSCWAYAYAYMFSYRACIKSGGKYNELISTEQLVACEWGGSCGGGWDSRAAAAMHENWDEPTAMPSFGEHPYTHSRGSSSAASCMSRDLEDIRSGAVRAYAVDMPTIATANYRDDRYYFGNCKRYSSASSKEEHERWIQYQIQTGGPVTSVMTAKAFPRTGSKSAQVRRMRTDRPPGDPRGVGRDGRRGEVLDHAELVDDRGRITAA